MESSEGLPSYIRESPSKTINFNETLWDKRNKTGLAKSMRVKTSSIPNAFEVKLGTIDKNNEKAMT